MAALALAVRDHLRDTSTTWYGATGFRPVMAEISLKGQPFASSGDLFLGICDSTWSGQDVEGLYEQFGVQVVVSMRGTGVARDRWGPELMAKPVTGLWARVAIIRAQLHLDASADDILNRANAYIALWGGGNGFVEPPRLRDGGQAQDRPGSWWWSDNKENNGGLSQTIVLADAGRVQRSDGPMT